MRRIGLSIVAFLAAAAALGFAAGETLYRPDRLWDAGLYISLSELHLTFSLLGAGVILAAAAGMARPARRVLAVAAAVCLVSSTLPIVSALRRPAEVAREMAAQPRSLEDTRALSAPEGPFVLYLVGDTGHVPESGAKIADAIARRAADQTVPVAGAWLLGDVIEDHHGKGYDAARLECLEEPLRPLTEAGIRLFGVLGNHDYDSGAALHMVNDPVLNMGGMNYYRRVFGDNLVSVFVLDSEVLRREPQQIVWLRRAVAEDTSRWRLLMLHHPPVASDVFHRDNPFTEGAIDEVVHGLPGIDAVFTGHNHFYERRHPIGSTTYVTVGSGSRKPERRLPADPGRATGYTGLNIFLEMTADRTELSFRAFDRDGAQVDSFRIRGGTATDGEQPGVPVAALLPAGPGDI